MANIKFEINRLASDELAYELAIRGITNVSTVDQSRKTLRNLLKLERQATPIDYPEYPFDFEEDSDALKGKITDITDWLKDFDGSDTNLSKKIFSKIAHALGRVNRSVPENSTQKSEKSELIINILNVKAQLEKLIKTHERSVLNQSQGVLDLSLININSSDSESVSEDEPPISPRNHIPLSKSKMIPISTWNLKFTGENDDFSLSAFLQRVEEMRIARNATSVDLFNGAIDLFSGKALIFYRAVRKTVQDWSGLVNLLREEFQPPDYNDKLFNEIRNRTQGPRESIGMYLAVMSNMFERLTISVPEQTRLKILMNNIAPFYQSQLALTEINSISELLKLGRILEHKRTCLDSFVPPPSRKSTKMLEPDLAYIDISPSCSNNIDELNVQSSVKCFNCNQFGHISVNCDQPKKRRCFKCNKPNFTVRTCPNCNRNSGNFQRRQ